MKHTAITRRSVLEGLSAIGIGSATLGRALAARAAGESEVTEEMLQEAEWVAGLSLSDEERALMLRGLNENLARFEKLRAVEVDNAVAPALGFRPLHRDTGGPDSGARPISPIPMSRPSDADLAFRTVSELGGLIRAREISSEELTRLYLARLKEHDPALRCVITRTDELALEQARRADEEIAAGNYRGPLHGIPWGAKDLLAVPGYRTTWGAMPYKDQVRRDSAAVYRKLSEAGAVLVAKTSVGALAWGDVWFDAKTKNPWNTEQGSSGSSAGSAATTAAGLVGFAIGTETWGSIVSPCTRCGVTGLRPTFGRVSRAGTMALSWSMDKIGPIARSAEDCALVFDAIRGADPADRDSVDGSFAWPSEGPAKEVQIGYVPAHFEGEGAAERRRLDQATLVTLEELGYRLVEISLDFDLPVNALSFILTAEAAAAFDDLTRSGRDDELVRQVDQAWPNVFRQGQMIPAVEYIRANRIRSLVMARMEEVMAGIDLFVAPSFEDHLLMTNLTGHPSVVVPNGFREGDGTPTSITFTGRLMGEGQLLTVAHAYQQATGFHRQRPPLGG